jgi:hypothetical protein
MVGACNCGFVQSLPLPVTFSVTAIVTALLLLLLLLLVKRALSLRGALS